MSVLNIAFLWNLHQPYYKNTRGIYQMPWVRFHGTKDYADFLLILKEFPSIRQNINLVPSLLLQLEDYLKNGARDNIWILSEVPAAELTPMQQQALLESFFLAHVQNMIKPQGRYYELYLKYKYDARHASLRERLERFTTQDFRDLQVWYNLIWIGQMNRRRPAIRALFEKGRDFSEADKATLFQEILTILGEIIPLHKSLWESGQIELSASPFYHPILPLLIDSSVAQSADPHLTLPRQPFTHPEDAREQLSRGLEYFQRLFGRKPVGVWPAEGGISQEAAHLIAQHKIKWVASDETVLAKTLNIPVPTLETYRPYQLARKGRPLYLFFRDPYLSDTIGFVYSHWQEERAVNDFIARLHAIRRNIITTSGEARLSDHIVSIILEGENCWEHYPRDGRSFLRKLFQRLSEEDELRTCTFSEFLERQPSAPQLEHISPGTWVDANFNIWIGGEEDNRAWDLLQEARRFLVDREKKGVLSGRMAARAWEHIYIAEGSDWCWWYGDEHSSAQDQEFDQLFREHLMKVYEIAGGEVPAVFYKPIKRARFDRYAHARPLNFIRPLISGKVTHFYEWVGAAVYDTPRVMPAAVQPTARIIDKLHVGFDEENFYFRLDFHQKPDWMYEFVIAVRLPRLQNIVISPLRGIIEKFDLRSNSRNKCLLPPRFKLDTIFEAALAFDDLEVQSGDLLGFQMMVRQNQEELEIFPPAQTIEIEVPDEDYESREWYV